MTEQVEENGERDVRCNGRARPLGVAGRGGPRAAVGVAAVRMWMTGEFAEFTDGSDKASRPAAEWPMMCLQEHEADPAAEQLMMGLEERESDGASTASEDLSAKVGFAMKSGDVLEFRPPSDLILGNSMTSG